MSCNQYLVCTDCKKYLDVAQGYQGDVRPTLSSRAIVNFMDSHHGHNLKMVSEYDEDTLENCDEVDYDITNS